MVLGLVFGYFLERKAWADRERIYVWTLEKKDFLIEKENIQ